MSTVNITVNALNEPLATPAPYVIPVRFTQPDSNVSGVSTPLTIDLHVEVNNDLVQSLAVNGILIAESLDVLNAGFPSTSFIFNSSGIQGGTRYNNWDDLMVAVADNRYGGPRNILFEQNETLDVAAGASGGPYDLRDIIWLGNGIAGYQPGGITVTIPTGFTISDWSFGGAAGGLFIDHVGTSPAYTWSGPLTWSLSFASIQASAAAPFFDLTPSVPGEVIAFAVRDGGAYWGVSGNPVANLNLNGGGFGYIAVHAISGSGTRIYDDSLSGDVELYGWLEQSANTDPIYFFPTHAALTVTVFDFSGLGVPASGLSYTATTVGDWNSNNPTSAADALDQLAARTTHPEIVITGNYYPVPAGVSSLTVSNTVTANRCYLTPFVPAKTFTADRLGLRVNTGVAATNVRLGIYDGRSGDLVLDAGTASTATSATDAEVTISQSLVGGRLYYLAAVFDGAPAIAAFNQFNPAGASALSTNETIACSYFAHVYAALPSTLGTLAYATGGTQYTLKVMVRAA